MGNNLQNLVTQNIQWSGYALGPPSVVPFEVADAGKSADRGRQTANSRWSQNHRLRLLTEPKALPWTFGRFMMDFSATWTMAAELPRVLRYWRKHCLVALDGKKPVLHDRYSGLNR
jgi:hypothetical protein